MEQESPRFAELKPSLPCVSPWVQLQSSTAGEAPAGALLRAALGCIKEPEVLLVPGAETAQMRYGDLYL